MWSSVVLGPSMFFCYGPRVARFDDSGWRVDPLSPWPLAGSWSLFAPEASSRMDEARWRAQAERFFSASLAIAPAKRYPDGSMPRSDAAEVAVRAGEAVSRVRLQTLPLEAAPGLRRSADEAVVAIGGAGFDALMRRATRLWQVAADGEGDARAPLVVTAVLASVLLAPVLPPGGGTVFGVKGCRERLSAQGWKV